MPQSYDITTLLTLPPELQLEIAKNLSATDLIKLRTASSSLFHHPTLKDLLKEKIRAESFLVCTPSHTFWSCLGQVFACGLNNTGQLGLGNTSELINDLTKITFPLAIGDKIIRIVAAREHTFFLTTTGQVFACGKNNVGQLGLRGLKNRYLPAEVKFPLMSDDYIQEIIAGPLYRICWLPQEVTTAKSIYRNIYSPTRPTQQTTTIIGGTDYSMFLTVKGRIFACGDNYYGQLGLGHTKQPIKPTEVTFLQVIDPSDRIDHIVMGQEYQFFLTHKRRVFACGKNEYGRLGLQGQNNYPWPTEVFFPLTPNDHIVQIVISAGGYNFFLSYTGRIFTCGNNNWGEPGLGDRTKWNINKIVELTFLPTYNFHERVQKIVVNLNNTFFLTSKGRVFACGKNECGCLGVGKLNSVLKPTEIKFLLASNDSIKDIVAGELCGFFLTHKGHLFACGNNYYGQLGTDDKINQVTPIEITFFRALNVSIKQVIIQPGHTFFITQEGLVFACGSNAYCQLGVGNTGTVYYSTIVLFPQPEIMQEISLD